jgi:hypothetical protein
MAHKHKWRLSGYTSFTLFFRCSCGEERSRRSTKAEYDWIVAGIKDMHHMAIHKLFHKFLKEFAADATGRFKWSGWELMQKICKFAERHPECILLPCDDNYHASSDTLLIPHEDEYEYWGTTAIIVPQNGEPVEIFMYPDELKLWQQALVKLNKRHTAKAPLTLLKEKKRKESRKAVGFGLKPKEPLLSDSFIAKKEKQANVKSCKVDAVLAKARRNGLRRVRREKQQQQEIKDTLAGLRGLGTLATSKEEIDTLKAAVRIINRLRREKR